MIHRPSGGRLCRSASVISHQVGRANVVVLVTCKHAETLSTHQVPVISPTYIDSASIAVRSAEYVNFLVSKQTTGARFLKVGPM